LNEHEKPLAPEPDKQKPFVVKAIPMNPAAIWKSDCAAELLEILEGPDHK